MRQYTAKEYDVTIGGHICLDIIPDLSGIKVSGAGLASVIAPGKLVNVGGCCVSTGGAVSNTGFALSKFGARAAFSTRIGDDQFGRIVISEIKKYGPADGVSTSKKSGTSYTVVLCPPDVDRVFLHYTGANDEYSSQDLPQDILRRSRIFHFGYPPLMRCVVEDGGKELAEIFKIARRCGCVTSLDMSLPDPDSFFGRVDWPGLLSKVLPHVDIFLPSFEEMLFMFDKARYLEMKKHAPNGDIIFLASDGDFECIARKALALGVSISAIKGGTRGWLLITKDIDRSSALGELLGKNLGVWSGRALWQPAWKAEKFVGATGSGDCSIAGFLRAVIADLSPEESLKAAVCAGWQNVQMADSLGGLKTWSETLKLISDGGVEEFDPRLGEGWGRNGNSGVWEKEQMDKEL